MRLSCTSIAHFFALWCYKKSVLTVNRAVISRSASMFFPQTALRRAISRWTPFLSRDGICLCVNFLHLTRKLREIRLATEAPTFLTVFPHVWKLGNM